MASNWLKYQMNMTLR